MARKVRIEYEGATYQVRARGNQGRERNSEFRDLPPFFSFHFDRFLFS